MIEEKKTIPRISIIVPVYNAERFLRQCLDSVLAQPLKDIEIICVNDGSTDSSALILDMYAEKDQRIHVIHQENQGNGIARNRGLDVATGEYIHFLDSDDYLVDDVYEKIYEIAHKLKLDYLYLKAYTIDAFTDEEIGGFEAIRFSLAVMRAEDYKRPFSIIEAPEIITSQMFPPWCGLYCREFLREHNIRFTALQSSTDHPFFYAVISHAKRVMAADVYVVNYRTNNPNSLVGILAKTPENQIKAYDIISKYCRFLPRRNYVAIQRYQLQYIMHLCTGFLDNGMNKNRIIKIIRNFVNSIDLSQATDNCIDELWYSDYLILKLDLDRYESTLSESDKVRLLIELEKTLWATLPLPLSEVQRDSRIVLYGAGYIGKKAHKLFEISQFCEVVLWVDRNWELCRRYDLPIFSPDDIITIPFDYILIAVEKRTVALEIMHYLMQIGIPNGKIITNNRLHQNL